MRFQTPLVSARLIRRYKRFLADIRLEDGRDVTAHCANPGSMMGLKDEGIKIWVEPNDDPKKKLKYGWRLVDHETGISPASIPPCRTARSGPRSWRARCQNWPPMRP